MKAARLFYLGSAWRPCHLSSANEVEMDMIYLLSAMLVAVEYQPVSILCYPFRFCYLFGCQKEFPHQGSIIFLYLVYRGYMFLGNDEDMDRALGIDIPEGQDLLILKDYIRFYLTTGHLAEQAV